MRRCLIAFALLCAGCSDWERAHDAFGDAVRINRAETPEEVEIYRQAAVAKVNLLAENRLKALAGN